uniref:Uncharacterized protein n=1 Tax=Leersia perrieri TaxID=77586 RepID=A0A0D9X3I7_9ORYZ
MDILCAPHLLAPLQGTFVEIGRQGNVAGGEDGAGKDLPTPKEICVGRTKPRRCYLWQALRRVQPVGATSVAGSGSESSRWGRGARPWAAEAAAVNFAAAAAGYLPEKATEDEEEARSGLA